MHLADHLRPLLRDHDCVIIPDFGGLVAEDAPARVQPGGRHLLSPPSRPVAFNQALTRNDGLLVDALRQHLGLPAPEAREQVRHAVAALHHELRTQQRTELPGIGVFRQVADRGLQFEYTGADNLRAAAFGLPELTAHPVRTTDIRLAREQQAQLGPRLRSAGRGLRLRRVLPGAAIGLLAGLAVAALYQLSLNPAVLPVAWRGYVPRWETAAQAPAPQQATLAHTGLGETARAPAAPVAAAPAHDSAAGSTPEAPTTEKAPANEAPAKEMAAAAPATVPTTPAAAPRQPVAKATSVAAKAVVAARPAASPRPAAPVVAKAPAVVPAAPVAATTIKARTGRYYVIVAAYSSLGRAEEGRRNLAHAGRPAKVILPPAGSRLFRLSAGDFADQPAARLAAARLRQNPHFDKGLTVLSY